jgi:hypothetical protein
MVCGTAGSIGHDRDRKGRCHAGALSIDCRHWHWNSTRRAATEFEPFEQEACLDRSERTEHLGGVLGAALLDRALVARWVKRRAGRVIEVSAAGKAAFASVLGAP